MIKRFKRGTAIYFQNTIKDVDKALFNPDTSIQIQIIDPDGTEELALTTMTQVSTGLYSYTWQSAVDDPVGVYDVRVVSVDGSYTAKGVDTSAFELHDD